MISVIHLLFMACKIGNENLVKCLIELWDDINEESYIGNNLLFHACESGNENIVKYLVKHGVDVKKNKSWNDITFIYGMQKWKWKSSKIYSWIWSRYNYRR